MSRGFYTLTSAMLTQQRKIEITSNNIANFNTAGYKKQEAVTTTFGSILINKLQQNGIYESSTPLSTQSFIRIADDNNIIHSQGTFDTTGFKTDFALVGNGFFGVRNPNTDEIRYSRDGSFNIDQEGYLIQGDNGRVQGEFGDVFLGTDKFETDNEGRLFVEGEEIDKIMVYDFEDYADIDSVEEGLFNSNADPIEVDNPKILNGVIERSNVDLTDEMTDYMSSQRALQSASQIMKMYDRVASSAVNKIGNV